MSVLSSVSSVDINGFSCKVSHTQWKTWNLKDLKAPPQQLNTSGEIKRRFFRGSIELVIPTANFTPEVVKSLPEFLLTSVWANVADGPVLKIVLNAG